MYGLLFKEHVYYILELETLSIWSPYYTSSSSSWRKSVFYVLQPMRERRELLEGALLEYKSMHNRTFFI